MKLKRTLLFSSFIFAVLLLVNFNNYAHSATYSKYVQAKGNDSLSGDSVSQAWATIEKVNDFLDSLSGGDTASIYFNSGDMWTISEEPIGMNNGGANYIDFPTADVTLIFDAYGSGAKPKIITAGRHGFNFADEDIASVTIQNIESSGDGSTGQGGIRIYNIAGDVTIDNVTCNSNGGGTQKRNNGGGIVWLVNILGKVSVANSDLYNSTPKYNTPDQEKDSHAILIWMVLHDSEPRLAHKTSGSVKVINNKLYNVSSDSIQVAGVAVDFPRTIIADNEMYNFGEQAIDIKASRHVDIYGNKIYRNGYPTGGSGGGYCGIVFTGKGSTWSMHPADVKIFNNYFTTNRFGGIRVARHEDDLYSEIYQNYFDNVAMGIGFAQGAKLRIYNNVIDVSKDQAKSNWPIAGIWAYLDPSSDTKVYNNTIYVHPSNPSVTPYGILHSASNATYKNNVIYVQNNKSDSYPFRCSAGTPTIANNSYYNLNNSNTYNGCGMRDSHAVTSDPGINFLAGEYWPANNTDPIVEAGISNSSDPNVPSHGLASATSWDPINVKTVSRDAHGGPDIGAYEYDGSPSHFSLEAPKRLSIVY